METEKNEMRDVRAVVRTYKDKETGEEKNVYRTVGTAFVSPHGSTVTIILETRPIDPNWNGKLYINKPYEKKDDEPEVDNKDDDPIPLDKIPF